MKIFPAFLGTMGRDIVGEVGICLMQTLRRKVESDPEHLFHPSLVVSKGDRPQVRIWQTRPYGEVRGVGIKGPKEITEKIPTFLPADYGILASYFSGGQ